MLCCTGQQDFNYTCISLGELSTFKFKMYSKLLKSLLQGSKSSNVFLHKMGGR